MCIRSVARALSRNVERGPLATGKPHEVSNRNARYARTRPRCRSVNGELGFEIDRPRSRVSYRTTEKPSLSQYVIVYRIISQRIWSIDINKLRLAILSFCILKFLFIYRCLNKLAFLKRYSIWNFQSVLTNVIYQFYKKCFFLQSMIFFIDKKEW